MTGIAPCTTRPSKLGSLGLILAMGTSGLAQAAPPPPAPDESSSPSPETSPEASPKTSSAPGRSPAPDAALRAQQHFKAGEWDAAVEALMEAYAADPNPAYLYARAQAERMRGNCRVAIPLYQRFLQHGVTEQQRADTERHIRLCEEILFNEQADPEPEPAPAPSLTKTPPPEPPPASRDTPTHPWTRDTPGLTLLATGAAATAVGGILWGLGAREVRRAPMASVEEAYERQVAQGRRDIGLGVAMTVVGVALAVSGTIRLGVIARRHRARVSAWLSPGTGGVHVSTRF
ncbi:MAG: hypothetical protein AAGF11_08355 [Myxococcota bacterium]